MNLTPPLNFISASRSPCRAFAYAAAKSSNLRTTSLCCQLPLFFFLIFFFMAFSVQSELPPSHQLLLEHLERAFSKEKENSPPKERQSQGNQLRSACGVPAAQ